MRKRNSNLKTNKNPNLKWGIGHGGEGGGLRQACHDGAAVRDTWRKEEGIRLKLFKKQIFEIQSVIHKGFASNPIDQTKGNSFPKTMISETNVHIAEINSISLRKREN